MRRSACRTGSVALLAAALLAMDTARPARAEEPPRARVRLEAPGTRAVVGQPLALTLAVAYDEAWFAAHALPLSPRAAGLPLHVQTDLVRPRPGLRLLAEAGPPGSARLAVGDELLAAAAPTALPDDLPAGWRLLHVTRWVVAERAGPLRFEAPVLRYAWAERFGTDALGARVPLASQQMRREGEALQLEVAPLPPGAPAGYAGLVGALALRATADAAEVAEDGSLHVVLLIEGEGNQELLDLPRPAGLEAAFHVLAVEDERAPFRRRLRFEVRPRRADLAAVPALGFPAYDPVRGAYVALASAPLPLRVRPRAPAPAPSTGPAPGDGAAPGARGAPVWLWPAAAALLLVGLRTALRRRRQPATPDGQAERCRLAHVAFAAAARQDDADLAGPFAEVLAAHLRTAPGAVVGARLAERLAEAGLPPALAAEASATLEALLAARYGARPSPAARSAAGRVAAALEARARR